MRVLHIHAGNLYGGVETMLVTLARHRDATAGLIQEFAVCFEGKSSELLRRAGAQVHVLGAVRLSRLDTVAKARRRLAALISANGYDAVICHSAWPHAVFAPTVRASSSRLIFWLHDVVNGRQWIERWASFTTPDLAICNSHFTRDSLRTMFPHVDTEVVYCPVESGVVSAEVRAEVRREMETPENAAVVIQVSRMEPLKGHAILLRALAGLGENGNWQCWIVGGAQRSHEAQYLEQLKAMANGLRLGQRVKFVGQRDDVARLLNGADVFCQPNVRPESFGIAMIEAQYANLPVVTSALGGALEAVDASCGVLTPAGDADALRSALRSLIVDSALRAKLGAAGPTRAAAKCDSGTQVQRLATLLDEVVSARERSVTAFAPNSQRMHL